MQLKIVMLIFRFFKDLQNILAVVQHTAGMLKYIIVKRSEDWSYNKNKRDALFLTFILA
jgi:hypothetical protein